MKQGFLLITLRLAPLAAVHADDLLLLTSKSAVQAVCARMAGPIEIAPVHLPSPDAGFHVEHATNELTHYC